MDRFVLTALVREVAPMLLGRRVRGQGRWGKWGFTIQLGSAGQASPRTKKRGRDLVVSLSPQAPGFYVGLPPPDAERVSSLPRFKKLLMGSQLASIEPAPLDRVVSLTWEQTKPSGERRSLELVLEWAATRTAAYLVDCESRETLDLVCPGTPRIDVGEVFRPLAPRRDVPSSGRELMNRLEHARREGLAEERALTAASGLGPLLAEEMGRVQARTGTTLEGAFEEIVRMLNETPQPVLLAPSTPAAWRGRGRPLLSTIALSPREGWTARHFDSLNDAAAAFVSEALELATRREVYQGASSALRRRLKKLNRLREQLDRDEQGLADPAQLRRWGELLLAGLRQAQRVDGAVMVPDPYDPDAVPVRVPIDPRRDLASNADRYFRHSRKVGRSREVIEVRRSKLVRQIEYLETLELALKDASAGKSLLAVVEEIRESGTVDEPAAERRRTKETIGREPARLEPRRFRIPGGAVILAGRSARSNEELTFRIAGPDELWFHAAGAAGAHVVLRLPGGRQAASAEIEKAAAVAAFYSKARGATAAEVIFTPRRNVKKIPGAPPGTVRLARYQSVRVKPALPPGVSEDNG